MKHSSNKLTRVEIVDIALHLALFRARLEASGRDARGLRRLERRVRILAGCWTDSREASPLSLPVAS